MSQRHESEFSTRPVKPSTETDTGQADQRPAPGESTHLGGIPAHSHKPDLTETAIADLYRAINLARTEVARADSKASLLAAGAIPIAGGLLAAPSLTTLRGHVLILAWVAAALVFVGIGFLGSVVWPRLSGNVGLCFVSTTPPEELADIILERSRNPEARRQDAAMESSLVARLAIAKYRRIRRAMLCFVAAGVVSFAACIALMLANPTIMT